MTVHVPTVVILRGSARPIKPISADPAGAGRGLIAVGSILLGAAPDRCNAVISPYSVFAVSAMAAMGARGRTAGQLNDFLGSADPGAHLRAIAHSLSAAVRSGAPQIGDPRYRDARPMAIHTANGLFVAHRAVVKTDFLDGLAGEFGAGLGQLDFTTDPDAARRVINFWVAENAPIDELLGEGSITRDTVLVLVNAVHLTAPWRSPFARIDDELPFYPENRQAIAVNYLRTTAWFARKAGEGWTSVTIPYRGGAVAMTVVVPEQGHFDVIKRTLSVVLPVALDPGPPLGPVDLSLPGFALDTRLSMTDVLRRAGVIDLFDPAEVDLSGIAGVPGDLVASELIHRAMVNVDKDGTEASAATALSMSATGRPVEPVRVVIDRSFLFAVHDISTGAPIFLGQVINPTE